MTVDLFEAEILGRLAAIDRAHPRVDRAAAERALAEHFLAGGLAPLPVRWTADGVEGCRAAEGGGWNGPWIKVNARVTQECRDLPWCLFTPDARSLAFGAPSRPDAAWGTCDASTLRAAREEGGRETPGTRPRSPGLSAMMGALWDFTAPELRRLWLPLVDAAEAGLWVFWVLEREVVAVPRPAIRTWRGALHSEEGPAVAWPGGARFWFLRGVRLPRRVVEDPGSISVGDICGEPNAEVRRAMLERFGFGRFVEEARLDSVHADECGRLYRAAMGQDEPIVMVRVENSTPGPDGARKAYFLRVPPDTRTARAAVAWTFGLSGSEYRPRVQT